MFIEVSFGQDMTQLFNTNVTNNILLDYIKNAVRAQMVEELGGKEEWSTTIPLNESSKAFKEYWRI